MPLVDIWFDGLPALSAESDNAYEGSPWALINRSNSNVVEGKRIDFSSGYILGITEAGHVRLNHTST